MCGGGRGDRRYSDTTYTCREWNTEEGNFPMKTVHEFKNSISYHVSWTPVSKTYLFGGGDSANITSNSNTTTVTPGIYDGTPGNTLTYPLWGACSIPDPDTDTVVITGGRHSKQITSLYNVHGFVKYLGNLNHEREYHGCTSYFDDQNRVYL